MWNKDITSEIIIYMNGAEYIHFSNLHSIHFAVQKSYKELPVVCNQLYSLQSRL